MLTVSNYHYIRPDFTANFPSIFGMTPAMFENQLNALSNEGDFIHPKELLANFNAVVQSKSNYHLITFDDGLKEQYDYALPILDALGIPAVFFMNSINFDEKKTTTVHKIHLLRSALAPFEILEKLPKAILLSSTEKERAQTIYRYDDPESAALKYLLNFKMSFDIQEEIIDGIFADYFEETKTTLSLYMNQDMLIELAQNGYLGSHTHHHYPLGLLEETSIKFELQHSKNFFEKLTNTKVEMVSYPYGTVEASNDKVAEIAKKVGYEIGFTTNRGINVGNENPLLLNRFDCNDLPGGKNYKK